MNRRTFISVVGLTYLSPWEVLAQTKGPQYITKSIPATGQILPVIGMGSSRTFNVGNSKKLRDNRSHVLSKFFQMGGQLIDSSPMYGSSESVIGHGLKKWPPKNLLSATKVWTSSSKEGREQFQESINLWGQKNIDIYQIHNLVNWQEHLKILRQYKKEGKIKYIGITTSHGRRTDEFNDIMKKEKIDFAQLTYNLEERWNEKETLAIAKDKGIGVIVNRPFQRGDLFDKVEKKKLPEFVKEIGCDNWAQYFLKWVVSHPSVTCAIPATSKVSHMVENMGAQLGKLPDKKMRQQMLAYYQSL